MARDDQRDRVAAERLPDRARERNVTEPPRDLAVGGRLAPLELEDVVIDLPVEIRLVAEIERHVVELDPLPLAVRDDAPSERWVGL